MKIKNTINLAGGCIVGLFIGSLLFTEGEFLAKYVIPEDMGWLSFGIRSLSIGIAVGIFVFILRYFSSMKSQRLTVYYLFSVLISTAIVILLFYAAIYAAGIWIQESALEVSDFFNSKLGIFFSYNIFFVIFFLISTVFSGAFTLITKRKVNYIQYISREIKTIEKEGFGRTVKVIGNDELADLCISINHMSEELFEKECHEKQLEAKKNELITNVSHDLRSPLTSIIGYVNLLKKEGAQDPKKFQEYIDVVDRRLCGLHVLINELFELTKLNESDVNLNFEKLDIIAILKHMASENSILFQQQGLELEGKITPEVYEINLDAEKIVRALQNLFENARKYAKENTRITVAAIINNGSLHISFANCVRNKDIIQVENLFDRFYKGDLSRSDTQSAGLGLAIVKKIVELHGGVITAQLEEDRIMFDMCFG